MAEIQTAAINLIVAVVIGLIGVTSAYAAAFLNKLKAKAQAEINKMDDQSLKDYLSEALGQLNDVARKTVMKIEATSASKLREAVKDGKIDRSELTRLSTEAYEEIIKTMSPQYMEFLDDVLGNTETYIMGLIEEKLAEIKAKNILPSIVMP